MENGEGYPLIVDAGHIEEFRIPACLDCAHFHADAATCDAFPDDIPAEIFLFGNPHTQPYPGDHGSRFEPLATANHTG